jgi:hypothetical protein
MAGYPYYEPPVGLDNPPHYHLSLLLEFDTFSSHSPGFLFP